MGGIEGRGWGVVAALGAADPPVCCADSPLRRGAVRNLADSPLRRGGRLGGTARTAWGPLTPL